MQAYNQAINDLDKELDFLKSQFEVRKSLSLQSPDQILLYETHLEEIASGCSSFTMIELLLFS